MLGTEKVTVPAGTFEALKVSVNDVDGPGTSTLWIASADRNTVKLEANMPQMGNARIVMELSK